MDWIAPDITGPWSGAGFVVVLVLCATLRRERQHALVSGARNTGSLIGGWLTALACALASSTLLHLLLASAPRPLPAVSPLLPLLTLIVSLLTGLFSLGAVAALFPRRRLGPECAHCAYSTDQPVEHPRGWQVCPECGCDPRGSSCGSATSKLRHLAALPLSCLSFAIVHLLIPLPFVVNSVGQGELPWRGSSDGVVTGTARHTVMRTLLGGQPDWAQRWAPAPVRFLPRSGSPAAVVDVYTLRTSKSTLTLYSDGRFVSTGSNERVPFETPSIASLLRAEAGQMLSDADCTASASAVVNLRQLVTGVWSPASGPAAWTVRGGLLAMTLLASSHLGLVLLLSRKRGNQATDLAPSASATPVRAH